MIQKESGIQEQFILCKKYFQSWVQRKIKPNTGTVSGVFDVSRLSMILVDSSGC